MTCLKVGQQASLRSVDGIFEDHDVCLGLRLLAYFFPLSRLDASNGGSTTFSCPFRNKY